MKFPLKLNIKPAAIRAGAKFNVMSGTSVAPAAVSGIKSVSFTGKVTKPVDRTPSESELRAAFKEAAEKYGTANAQWAERMFRWETSHFKSKQFKYSLSPGMEIPDNVKTYPYGWTSMKPFWDNNESLQPIGYIAMQENAGAQADKNVDRFVSFPSFKAALFSVMEYLEKYNPGRWYSTDLEKQAKYESKLRSIKTKFV